PRLEVRVRQALGESFRTLRRFDEAEAQFRLAEEAGEGLSDDKEDRRERLVTRAGMARLLRARGRYEEGLHLADRVAAEQRDVLGPDDHDTILTEVEAAIIRPYLGRLDEAEDALRALSGRADASPTRQAQARLILLNALGSLLVSRGKISEGRPLIEEALNL